MHARRLVTIACAAALALLISAVPARAGLVSNGGFETNDFTAWTQSGNTNNTWVAGVVDNPCGGFHSGDYAACFGPVDSLGYIQQDIATVPGAQYLVTFWVASDGYFTNELYADFGGNVLIDQSDIPTQGYTRYSYLAPATAATTTLKLGFRNDPGYLGLDDVDVMAATPEPGTLGLMFGGLATTLFFARRKRA